MFRRILLAWMLVIGTHAYALDTQSPDKLVDGLISQVLTELEGEKDKLKSGSDEAVYEFANRVVNKTILPHYDLPRMSAYIVGKPWKTATKTQKLTFMKTFKDMIIRTYAKSLLDYSGQKMTVMPYRATTKKSAVVQAKFVPESGEAVPVSFRLYKNRKKGWRIYDIAVAGASQIKAYQGSLRASIQKGGIDGAIRAMRAKGKS
jgi:phospholipid transport system substrate-binding protein